MFCNPETLARDVKILEEKGFECESVKGFDMFPWTHHIEAVAIMMITSCVIPVLMLAMLFES